MTHSELVGYGRPPCGGEIISEAPAPTAESKLRLPLLGQAAAPTQVWRCLSCGKRWTQEPRPEEAL